MTSKNNPYDCGEGMVKRIKQTEASKGLAKKLHVGILPDELAELQRKAELWDRVKEIANYDRNNAPRCDGCPIDLYCRGNICEVAVKIVDALEGQS